MALYCHCARCQRRSGTGTSANALAEPGSFRLLSGEPEDHERVSIRMGSFDGDPGIRPSVRQFTAYAAAWESIPDDGLRRHPESARLHLD